MANKQIPIDLQVLRVIAYRLAWLLVILTFLSFALSSMITSSLINLYTASITIFVDPESVLGNLAQGVAVTTNLNDQLATLQHLILSDDFLEPHVIQELSLNLQDVYVPPARLKFMPRVANFADVAKNSVKKLFGLEIYYQSDEQKRYLEEQKMIEALKKAITIQQSRGMLLVISYNGLNPTICQKIVEILANQCKEFLLRTKNQETREALRYIERQYQEANQKLVELERELANMRVEQFDKGPEARIALLRQRENALDAQRLIQQQLDSLVDKKRELIVIRSKRQTELRSDPQIITELAKIARSQEALEMDALNKRLEALRQTYTEEWPEVKTLKDQIARKEQTIQARIENDPQAEEKIFLADPLYNEYFRQITQIETDEASLYEQAGRLRENIAIYEDKMRAMPEIEKGFAAIERDINLYESLQVDLAGRRETARATMQLEQTRGEYRIRVMARSFPTQPSGLSPIFMMVLLCLVGPTIGAGIVFLVYYFNDSVKNPDDVAKEYNLPVIATIPKTNFKKELRHHKKHVRKLRRHARRSMKEPDENTPPAINELEVDGFERTLKRLPIPKTSKTSKDLVHAHRYTEEHDESAPPAINEPEVDVFGRTLKRLPIPKTSKTSKELVIVTMLTNPESLAAEEYRRLCFNVEWGIRNSLAGPCKTIAVTSALPGEGKTITAINLAMTLSRNHRVLLLDANFRTPTIHKVFGIPDVPGFSDLIAHNTTPELYVPESYPALNILPAGLSLAWPADLLGSTIADDLMESLKQSTAFDYAVLDVPPAAYLPDAPIVASRMAGVVWVIQELHTSKEVARSALTRIANPTIFGVVLNKSEQRLIPHKYTHQIQPLPRQKASKKLS